MTSSAAPDGAPKADVLPELTALLDEMTECATSLAAAMRVKQRILVENRLPELERAAQQEAQLAGRLTGLERRRIELMDGDGQDAQVPAGLRQQLTSTASEAWQAATGRLSSQLAELAQLNADNAYLSANMLEYTRMILQALSQGDGQPPYGSNGRVNPEAARELVNISV
jgi:flagellar biosynthesis/type III secretory pathway chaperone